ncbi:hypothetical protein H0H93_014353, partial [Arthromyces matolae]
MRAFQEILAFVAALKSLDIIVGTVIRPYYEGSFSQNALLNHTVYHIPQFPLSMFWLDPELPPAEPTTCVFYISSIARPRFSPAPVLPPPPQPTCVNRHLLPNFEVPGPKSPWIVASPFPPSPKL